jgi:hypothetical protein
MPDSNPYHGLHPPSHPPVSPLHRLLHTTALLAMSPAPAPATNGRSSPDPHALARGIALDSDTVSDAETYYGNGHTTSTSTDTPVLRAGYGPRPLAGSDAPIVAKVKTVIDPNGLGWPGTSFAHSRHVNNALIKELPLYSYSHCYIYYHHHVANNNQRQL